MYRIPIITWRFQIITRTAGYPSNLLHESLINYFGLVFELFIFNHYKNNYYSTNVCFQFENLILNKFYS